jgi:hypothetical protein
MVGFLRLKRFYFSTFLDRTSNLTKLLCYHLKLHYLLLAYNFSDILFIIVMFGCHNLFNQLWRVEPIVNCYIMLIITRVAGTSNILLVLDLQWFPVFHEVKLGHVDIIVDYSLSIRRWTNNIQVYLNYIFASESILTLVNTQHNVK